MKYGSTGDDDIPIWLLKSVTDVITSSLTHKMNFVQTSC